MTPTPADANIVQGTLRADMEKRRAQGERYSVREVVAILVPLSTDLIARFERGETFRLTPSNIRFEVGSATALVLSGPGHNPTLPRDRACLAPEDRTGNKGDQRAAVFSIGAIAYEMLTAAAVGPGMRRPSEIEPSLSATVDTILSKALIGDPAHRPADLGALTQALHHLAPTASHAPPPADEALLDGDDDLVVDVSLSMLPPPPKTAAPTLPRPAPIPRDLMAGASNDLIDVAQAPQGPPPIDPTSALADLKARLEADPRPRYVVLKDGMDHGPFSAVELLQQIGSHTFEAHHILVDSFSQDERPISDWDEFAPFAEHARLNKQIVAEKKEIALSVVAESKATRSKALFIGGVLAGVAVLGVGLWLIAKPKARRGEVIIDGHTALNIEFDGGLKGSTAKGPSGGKWSGSGSGDGVARPVLRGGMSCEQAMDTYVTELKMAGNKPDLTAGSFGGALNNGSYVVGCGAPFSMTVSICAAIQNGRAVGVTVVTTPSDPGIASCISNRVRGMSFPSHPALDVTRTVFKGE